MCICICILTSFLVRASHFGYEQASLELLQEIICSHSCLNIFLYNALLFITVKIFVFVLTKFGKPGLPNLVNTKTNFGVMGTAICDIIHMI